MLRRLATVALVAAAAFPSAAVAACGGASGGWQHAATITRKIDRVLPGALSTQVRLRSLRSGGEQRVLRLATNDLSLTSTARRVAVRGAGRRTLVAVSARPGWRTIELALDARAGTVALRVGGGRRASARAQLDPERALRIGGSGRVNTTTYSAPVYTVPVGQPTVHVTLDNTNDPALRTALDQVPIPAGATAAAGSDHHLVVWQPGTDTMWELWLATVEADGWHARWGGKMTEVSRNPGYFRAPHPGWGATATSLPLLGGLMRISELQAGHIDHALAFAIPHTKLWTSWSWPAQRSDGDVDSAAAIPEGARFRLPASLDIDALELPPVTAMMAKAVQRYGMVLRDKSGAVSFYAEDPTPLGGLNPYPALFDTWPNLLFAEFPWDKLQVLRTDMRGPVTGS
jgi:hypothetical protein